MIGREFKNVGELASWLAAAGIDTASWGDGETKRMADLWLEYVTGETDFQDAPPVRLVEVAQVDIRRGETVLIELAQEFADGRQRVRRRRPSEKLKRGEEAHAAAARCLKEELGLEISAVKLGRESRTSQEMINSPSYPGLWTRYLIHIFEAWTDNLPDEDFYRENTALDDPIYRHLWGWRVQE